MDESEVNVKYINAKRKFQFLPNSLNKCRPHLFYVDKRFLNAFLNKGIDYLILYAHYKYFKTNECNNPSL